MRQKNEACVAPISAQKGGLPDWRWVGRDFPIVVRKSRTNRWGLKGPYFWNLIEAKDGLFSESPPSRYLGD